MPKADILSCILDAGIIAIIRCDGPVGLAKAVAALFAGGVKAVEISLTTPGTLEVVKAVSESLPEGCCIGVGTVLDEQAVMDSVAAGAQFAVSPVFHAEVVQACNKADIPLACGAYTPTEAYQAHLSGADLIKIFPANQLGPDYMKALLAPLPDLSLVPTGGVTVENCGQYVRAGCVAVAIGTSVVNPKLIHDENWEGISNRAADYVRAVQRARAQM